MGVCPIIAIAEISLCVSDLGFRYPLPGGTFGYWGLRTAFEDLRIVGILNRVFQIGVLGQESALFGHKARVEPKMVVLRLDPNQTRTLRKILERHRYNLILINIYFLTLTTFRTSFQSPHTFLKYLYHIDTTFKPYKDPNKINFDTGQEKKIHHR